MFFCVHAAKCHRTHLTVAERRSHMALWCGPPVHPCAPLVAHGCCFRCVFAAPLILGGDVRTMTDGDIEIVSNPHLLRINQDPAGTQGKCIRGCSEEHLSASALDPPVQLWTKPLSDGSVAAILFNPANGTQDARFAPAEVGLKCSTAAVQSVWAPGNATKPLGAVHATVGAHDTDGFILACGVWG